MDGQVEIVVASGKGGVGKSMITASLAVHLHRKGYKLVAADADAEAPNLHIILGVDKWSREEPYLEGRIAWIREDLCTQCGVCAEVCPYGAVEIRGGKHWINPWICEGCLTCSLACPEKAIRYKLRVRSGTIRIAEKTRHGFPLVSAEITPGRPNSGKLVTEVKNRAHSILGGDGFILIDSAAGIGCQVVSSLTGAKIAILVAEPTPASLSDLRRIHKLTKHFLVAPGLVLNKYDLNEEGAEKVLEYARENNIPVLGLVPYDSNVPRAAAAGKPIIEYAPDSPAAKAVLEVAERVAAEILPDWRKWWSKYKPPRPEPYIPVIR